MPGAVAAKRFVFVIGGARSGKSTFALKRAGELGGPGLFIATARALDSEMERRIERHRRSRGEGWTTVEEPDDILKALERGRGFSVILIECITLWIANLMEKGLCDGDILKEVRSFIEASQGVDGNIITVSNEVGLGIVPENPIARRYRDLSGSTNQMMAEAADEVWFLAAGLPLRMK